MLPGLSPRGDVEGCEKVPEILENVTWLGGCSRTDLDPFRNAARSTPCSLGRTVLVLLLAMFLPLLPGFLFTTRLARTEEVVKSCAIDYLLHLFALTLRGPSGGHCVGLSERRSLTSDTLRAFGPSACGHLQPFCPPFKLHAVAPGGPPEGQCE
jgi:hypothetical protein